MRPSAASGEPASGKAEEAEGAAAEKSIEWRSLLMPSCRQGVLTAQLGKFQFNVQLRRKAFFALGGESSALMRTLMRARCSHGGGRCFKCVEHELLNYAEEGLARVQRADGAWEIAAADEAQNSRLVALQMQAATQVNGGEKYYDALIFSGALRALAAAAKRTFRAALKKDGADEDAAGKKAIAAAARAATRALAKNQRSWKSPRALLSARAKKT